MPPVVAKLPTAAANASPMGEGAAALTVMPQNFGEVISFADRMAESRFVPATLRGKPADCLAVCLQALRWGMDPFSVAQKTYFIKEGSPPAYEAQLVNAVVYARAPLNGRLQIDWTGTWPNRKCTVTGHIIGDNNPKVREVLAVNIKVRNSPLWITDPDQQLAYYATRAWARLYTPDVLMGVYTPDDDDMRADKARDVTSSVEPAERASSRLDALETAIEVPADAPMPADETFGLPATDAVDADGVVTEPLSEEAQKAEARGNEIIAMIDRTTDAAKIDKWMASHRDELAAMRAVNEDAAMAVVAAADARKRQLGDLV
jgi:hypothetical protein